MMETMLRMATILSVVILSFGGCSSNDVRSTADSGMHGLLDGSVLSKAVDSVECGLSAPQCTRDRVCIGLEVGSGCSHEHYSARYLCVERGELEKYWVSSSARLTIFWGERWLSYRDYLDSREERQPTVPSYSVQCFPCPEGTSCFIDRKDPSLDRCLTICSNVEDCDVDEVCDCDTQLELPVIPRVSGRRYPCVKAAPAVRKIVFDDYEKARQQSCREVPSSDYCAIGESLPRLEAERQKRPQRKNYRFFPNEKHPFH